MAAYVLWSVRTERREPLLHEHAMSALLRDPEINPGPFWASLYRYLPVHGDQPHVINPAFPLEYFSCFDAYYTALIRRPCRLLSFGSISRISISRL